MTFSADWLALREGADLAARNAEIADAVASRFALRDSISVVDLGSGTGANLRATAPLLPDRQTWRLIDSDEELLLTARKELCRWADAWTDAGGLHLSKGYAEIDVSFEVLDLSSDLAKALAAPPTLVTASAFFDLVSEDFIRRLVRLCTTCGAAFYATLTFNGVQRWSPHRPADNRIAAAFHRHQLSDKGFGPAAGPMAAGFLADRFRLDGYTVFEGDSPWRLSADDRMLIGEVTRGYAVAAAEIGDVDHATLESWLKVTRNAAEIGHTDVFAAPV